MPIGVKILVLLVCILLAAIVAIVAGLLSRSETKPRAAVLYGGGTFGGTMLLFLAILTALDIF